MSRNTKTTNRVPDVGTLTQWQLIRRRFARHRMALIAMNVLIVFYLVAAFVEFVAPFTPQWRNLDHLYAPPQQVRFSLKKGLHVDTISVRVDPVTLRRTYEVDPERPIPVRLFARGEPYRLWGFIPASRHLFGIDLGRHRALYGADAPAPTCYLLGADRYGRDLLTRVLYGARISLSVGLIGIAVTFVLGLTIGGISGYVGGNVDNAIQRTIEIINAFPKMPLWLALGAVMPQDWSAIKVYFGITVVLSLLGWTRLAGVVRGKILALREEDYAVAARLLGAGHGRVLFRHLLPGFTSHIIVSLTLSVPGMILGETSLSFLGLGLRPPVVSWGVMLQDAMNIDAVQAYPWLLVPAVFIVLTVLSFNFLGDGLRDAADPYSGR